MPAPRIRESTPLDLIIREMIKRDGRMNVSAFMELALSHPDHGYYTKHRDHGDPFGRDGDFITAPEITPLFGEIIGAWCAYVLPFLVPYARQDAPLRLIELGPGRGTLMADILRVVGRQEATASALAIDLVEVSAALKAQQAETLKTKAIPLSHADHIQDVAPGASVIIGNEFLDALPIEQTMVHQGNWHMRQIGLDDDSSLKFQPGPEFDNSDQWQLPDAATLEDGAIFELPVGGAALIDAIADRLRRLPGLALFIDYGHPEPAPGDTLQAMRNHAYANPLEAIGEADISAQVSFGALKQIAKAQKLEVYGPITQARFLGELGLIDRAQIVMEDASPSQRASIDGALARLLAPTGMGGLFKVMVLASPGISPPPPFTAAD